MSSLIIAEIGNNHQGSFKSAKEHIRVAFESGADLAKLQAFVPKDISGSMSKGFYEQCAFDYLQYVELIDYGKNLGIDVFYSIFSEELQILKKFQKWHKIAANQSQKNIRRTEQDDKENVIVSVKPGAGPLPNLEKALVLYASEYMATNPRLNNISFLNEYYQRNCGYSDHTIGVEYAVEAIIDYNCPVIEKHFTLTRNIIYDGVQFRDAVHGAMPYEMERLCYQKHLGGMDAMSYMRK